MQSKGCTLNKAGGRALSTGLGMEWALNISHFIPKAVTMGIAQQEGKSADRGQESILTRPLRWAALSVGRNICLVLTASEAQAPSSPSLLPSSPSRTIC